MKISLLLGIAVVFVACFGFKVSGDLASVKAELAVIKEQPVEQFEALMSPAGSVEIRDEDVFSEDGARLHELVEDSCAWMDAEEPLSESLLVSWQF